MSKTKSKTDKISSYNVGKIAIDIAMLFLGLIFVIGTIFGKGDEIAAVFVRIVGGALIVVGLLALINFLRNKEKTVFDWIVLVIGLSIAVMGILFIAKPKPVIDVFNYIFGIIIVIYAIVIIIASVGTLRPAGAKYWWFSLLFGVIALALGILIVCTNFASKTLTVIIGITLVVGSIGGMANAILASQAKKEYKANKKILDDATYTVDSTAKADSGDDASADDGVKY